MTFGKACALLIAALVLALPGGHAAAASKLVTNFQAEVYAGDISEAIAVAEARLCPIWRTAR